MKLKKTIVAIIVTSILAVSAVVTYILIKTKPETVKTSIRKNIIGVKTSTANYDSYSVSMSYPGRVTPRSVVKISSEVNGKIIDGDIQLKEGARFKKGDVIIRIYDMDVKANLKAKKSEFMNVLAKCLPDIKIDFPEEYDKWMSFFSSISIDEPLGELPVIKSDKEKVYVSSKNILSGYYNLVQQDIIMSRYEIKAPFNGVFTAVNKEVGAIAGAQNEIATIASTDLLELIVGVYPNDARILRTGTNVDVMSSKNKKYIGKIDRIASFVNPTTQRVNIYVVITEPSLEIIEGEMLSVTMPSHRLDNVLEVSREAVVGDSVVFRVEDNILRSQRIEVVSSTNDKSYVIGVPKDVRFVNESLVSPYDGMEVKLMNMNGELITPNDK